MEEHIKNNNYDFFFSKWNTFAFFPTMNMNYSCYTIQIITIRDLSDIKYPYKSANLYHKGKT